MKPRIRLLITGLILIVLAVLSHLTSQAAFLAPYTVWNLGDIFFGVSNGQYQVRAPDSTLKETIADGLGGYTTGCAFDTSGNLFTTNFTASRVEVYNSFDPHTPHSSAAVSTPLRAWFSTPQAECTWGTCWET